MPGTAGTVSLPTRRELLVFDTCGTFQFDPTAYPWATNVNVEVVGGGGSGGGCEATGADEVAEGGGGNLGGTSSFGGFLQATGGEGGDVGTPAQNIARVRGGDGGVGTGGDLNCRGGDGGTGVVAEDHVLRTNDGGDSVLGVQTGADTLSEGRDATAVYGGGSTGASSGADTAARASRAGGDGVVILDVIG